MSLIHIVPRRRRRVHLLWVAALGVAILLAACARTAPTPTTVPTEIPAATPEPTPSPTPKIVTIYVGPQLVDCEGEGPQKCMLVKENPSDEYGLFYDQIEGFEYEPGYEYTLEVEVNEVPNPPAGGSSLRYTLVQVVSKTPAATEGTLYVGPQLADCEGEGPQKCMLVKSGPADEYGLFYDQIEGFEYEEGYEYELRVRVEPVTNPPAGGSSLRYSLVEVVSKRPATIERTVYVGPVLVDCEGVGPQKCMLVKENPEDEYGMFYDPIEGFEYQEGYDYELLVGIDRVENPPADSSSLRYTLIEEVTRVPSIEGRLWTLVRGLDLEGQPAEVISDAQVTAEFRTGRVTGRACNRYAGAYEIDGDKLVITGFSTTLMICPAPKGVMDQERAYLKTLSSVDSFEVTEEHLTLLDESGTPILLYDLVLPAPLVGTNWTVLRYNNGKGGLASGLRDTEITALFAEDGSVTGSASCNTYNASYEVDGDRIAFGPVALTRKMCNQPQGIMEQEQAYLAALGSAATYSIRGDQLELRDAEGTRAVVFIPAD